MAPKPLASSLLASSPIASKRAAPKPSQAPAAVDPPVAAAFGCRVHSGWAALIAVAGPVAAPRVLARRRIELAGPAAPGGAQPFHAARLLALEQARELVERSLEGAIRAARRALAAAAGELRRQGSDPIALGLVQSSARPLPELAAVLASHALVHTAEGELFRNALAVAAAKQGLFVLRVRERELVERCRSARGADGERFLADLGRALGPPWRQDQKLATLAALLALALRTQLPTGA
ncbi:MAG: hypothetical protein JOZ15_01700 [Acidobacteria bacterium]|nr:hypothetical protein [Acidobacteriota bacterium]